MRPPGVWISALTLPPHFKEALCLIRLVKADSTTDALYQKLWGCSFWIYGENVEAFSGLWQALALAARNDLPAARKIFDSFDDEPWWNDHIVEDFFLPSIDAVIDLCRSEEFVVWTSMDASPKALIGADDWRGYTESSLEPECVRRLASVLSKTEFPISFEEFFRRAIEATGGGSEGPEKAVSF